MKFVKSVDKILLKLFKLEKKVLSINKIWYIFRVRHSDGIRLVILMANLVFLLFSFACQNDSNANNDDISSAWEQVPEILDKITVPLFPQREYLITEFGAVGDGETDCYSSFKIAVNKCNAEGGGKIVVPKGIFLTNGPIHLKSNVNLHLQKGAVIKFGSNPDDYLPVVLTRWEGTELFNYSPLVYAYMATNVAITGEGILNGNAGAEFAKWKPRQKPAQKKLRQMGNDGIPVYKRVFGKGSFLRPGMVQFFGCKNVLVEKITIKDAPFWCLHPVFCVNVTIRGITVDSRNQNNDGCNPDASVNVLIENCEFHTGDDGVAIKSGRDQDGWRIGQATENVIIRNCVVNSKINGLCIGSEMSGSVRNIFIENCKIAEATSVLYCKSNFDRGGRVENVYMRNIDVDRAKDALIRLDTNYKGHRGNHHPPLFQNFYIENIQCKKAENYAVYAKNAPGGTIDNIVLKNVTVDTARIIRYYKDVNNIVFDNVLINGKIQESKYDPSKEGDEDTNIGW